MTKHINLLRIKKHYLIRGENFLPASYCPNRINLMTQFYIIECFNNKESFIKIGSSSFKLSRRFNSKRLMPYSYKVIFQATENYNLRTDLFLALALESKFQNLSKSYRYEPQIKFGGYLECFSKELLQDEKFIRSLNFLKKITQ